MAGGTDSILDATTDFLNELDAGIYPRLMRAQWEKTKHFEDCLMSHRELWVVTTVGGQCSNECGHGSEHVPPPQCKMRKGFKVKHWSMIRVCRRFSGTACGPELAKISRWFCVEDFWGFKDRNSFFIPYLTNILLKPRLCTVLIFSG